MRQWLGLPSVSVLVESRRHRTFMDKLLDEPRFSALGNVFMSNLSRFLFFIFYKIYKGGNKTLPCYVSFILLACVYHFNVWFTFIFRLSAALV